MAKKIDSTPTPQKTLAQKVFFTTGRVVARASKIKKVVKLDKVSAVSMKAWEKTKTSSAKIGAGIKDGAVDIAKSFHSGFHSLKRDYVPTKKRVQDIFDGTAEETSSAEIDAKAESRHLSTIVIDDDYAGFGNVDIDREIEKIEKEVKAISD